MKRPHSRKLIPLLKGPRPTDHWRVYGHSDGCTGVPDMWWSEPCVWHDYGYHLCSLMPQDTPAELRAWRRARRRRDVNLKQNIRIMSDWSVSETGDIVKSPLRLKSWIGFLASRAYFRGVRWMGRRFAKRKEA